MIRIQKTSLPPHRNGNIRESEHSNSPPNRWRNRFLLLVAESEDEDGGGEEGFDGDLGVVDVGPFDGVLGVEAVADPDQGDSCEKSE